MVVILECRRLQIAVMMRYRWFQNVVISGLQVAIDGNNTGRYVASDGCDTGLLFPSNGRDICLQVTRWSLTELQEL